jgi:cytoskeletal protein CcmA (bactofilin family)
MSAEHLSLNENSAYVGACVTVKGDIVAKDTVIVEGTVEGNVAAGLVRIGPNGAIKGSLAAADAEIKGLLAEKADIKGFLHLRSTGRIEGKISCGDLEVERGRGHRRRLHRRPCAGRTHHRRDARRRWNSGRADIGTL